MNVSQVLNQDPAFFLEPLDVASHLLDYHRIWSDPASLIWSTQKPKENLEETREWLRRWTREGDSRIHNYAIMIRPMSVLNPSNPKSKYYPPPSIQDRARSVPNEKADPPSCSPRPYLIGQVGILRAAPEHDTAVDAAGTYNRAPEIGYMIHHTHWGLGMAGRALGLFLSYYWTILSPPRAYECNEVDERLDVLEAHIDPANAASEAIARKLGFQPGEFAGEEFRLAHSQELRRLRVWRGCRPQTVPVA